MWKRWLEKNIRTGTLKVTLPNGEAVQVGKGKPEAEIFIHRRSTVVKIVLNPTLKVGECYMEGGWSPGKGGLLAVMALLYSNVRAYERNRRMRNLLLGIIRRLEEINGAGTSRRNVHHHYDLNANLYRCFLDEDMQYSCAYFERPDMSLEAAQRAKCAHIGRKLMLKPGQRVLDIGSGWGGMALYLAREYDVEVAGLTLSQEQYEISCQRAREAGLEGRVQFLMQDYREHQDSYDAIVSVGMFEHVGRPQYGVFFNTVSRLLRPDGRALLHTIGHTGKSLPSNAWIRKYIFPGGYIPSLSEVMFPVEQSGLKLTDVEVLHGHYAETLAHWHRRFQMHRHRLSREMGERFCRMWEFYLQTSEAGFRWYDLVVFQLQLLARDAVAPRSRGYLYAGEATTPALKRQQQEQQSE